MLLIRKRIAEFCEQSSPFSGEIEVDESYFGARRIKGKRGRGAYGKTPVFGILQRGGKVYTEIVADCARKTLPAIIRGKVEPDSIIHSPMPGTDTAVWLTWDTKSIIVSTMAISSLPMVSGILTASSPSGLIQNAGS